MHTPSTAAKSAQRLHDLAALARRTAEGWKPLPHQVPPPGDWRGWLLMAGRFAGKTDACAHAVVEHVNGPPCMPGPIPHWMGIIGPTLGDAVRACYEGPSGIRAHDPRAIMVNRAGGTVIHWPNGSEAKIFGAHSEEDTDRLRAGGNNCFVWGDELAAWRYLEQAYAQMKFGLRIGPKPRWIASTTPRARPLIKKLDAGLVRGAVVTHATSHDNPHIVGEVLEDLLETYGNTSLGAQEIFGRIVDQDENALWTREQIEQNRILPEGVPDLNRITVGIDPSGGAGEQGIVVAGRALWTPTSVNPNKPIMHGFVLDDRTVHMKPEGWGRRAVRAAIDWNADDIVCEKNYGGDMVVSTVRGACEQLGVNIPIRVVTATRGKKVRAEPVSALTANGRWHHAGVFSDLEDQMCVWHDELDWSPDRLDACLIEGTEITTRRGQVPIEHVTTEDQVWTRSGWKPVQWSGMIRENAEVLRVVTTDGEFTATPDHKVWTEDRGFVRVDALAEGDPLSSCPNRLIRFLSKLLRVKPDLFWRHARTRVVRVCALETRHKVYDLTVADAHEFYANGILVHNCVWDAWHLKLVHTAPMGTGAIGSKAANRQIVPSPH